MKRLIAKPVVSLLVLFLINKSAISQDFSERLTNINQNWSYLELPKTDVSKLRASDPWQAINLPHTWNDMDATDMVPGYRRSASWYKKILEIKPAGNSRYFLYFEGANSTAQVYVNGKLAGTHTGAYLGFEIEITRLVVSGNNEILVRVDNSYNKQLIPSHQSDFFIFGGLTRDVWLKQVNEVFISDATIRTPKVDNSTAQTLIQVDVDGVVKGLSLQTVIKAPNGSEIFRKTTPVNASNVEIRHTMDNPMLWDIDDPNLYTVELTLKNGDKVLDDVTERIGYRWFEFKDHGPFYLNGKRLLLRGTHRHEEIAGYGAAMPNSMHRSDMEAIKEMGANFVRLGHYPQDPEVYKACDELGILIWDELPWCRGGVGDEAWKANTKRYLTEMIDQNYNHASVIIWSLGNEIYWLPEFEDGDNPEKINSYLKELNDLAHTLDPSRLTAIRKYYEGSDIVDVFSPSIWSGWYSGTYKNYKNAIDKSIKEYPRFVHMEYGGSSQMGRHSETAISGDGQVNSNEWEEPINQVKVSNIANDGDWSESYIVDLFDWHLHVSENHEAFAGNAQWAFRDFATPLRPENDIPYMNQKGLADRAGNPKDAYYVFKSYWAKDPFVYIESHTWTERSGPENMPRELCVFSNVDSVEFFLAGKSQGFRVRDLSKYPACGLTWKIHFWEGGNDLKAVGYLNGKPVTSDQMEVRYSFEKSGSPEGLFLSYKLLNNGNYLVSATARDIQNRRSLDYEERVYFQCLSGGTLVENMGTPTGTSAIKMSNGLASIEVVPEKGSKTIRMTVLNQYFKGTFLEIKLDTNP